MVATPMVAGLKASQATLGGNACEDGGHAAFIFLHALVKDLRTPGPFLRFSLKARSSEQPGNNELSTTKANLLAEHQIVSPTLKARFFAGVEMKGQDVTVPGKDEGSTTGERVLIQLSEGHEQTIKCDVQSGNTTNHNAYNLVVRTKGPGGDMTLGPVATLRRDHDRTTPVAVALNDRCLGSVNATVRTGFALGSDAGDSVHPYTCATLHTAGPIAI
jgi:hypothetical protein